MTRIVLLLLVLLAAPLAHAAETVPAPSLAAAVRAGWPATHAGEIAWRWVSAFDSGEPAMREFAANWRAPEGDASGSAHARIERYRDLRERFGTLTLHSVLKSAPDEVTARLLASDGSHHDFVFRVQSRPPYKLASLAMIQGGHDLGAFFRGLHH